MTLTEAQQKALDKLPITFDAENPVTTDGVQWRTAQALEQEGLATMIHIHRNITDAEQHQWLVEVRRGGRV